SEVALSTTLPGGPRPDLDLCQPEPARDKALRRARGSPGQGSARLLYPFALRMEFSSSFVPKNFCGLLPEIPPVGVQLIEPCFQPLDLGSNRLERRRRRRFDLGCRGRGRGFGLKPDGIQQQQAGADCKQSVCERNEAAKLKSLSLAFHG